MSGGSGSTTVSGSSGAARNLRGAELIDEHCRRAPAEPLRRYIAWYTGYRQRGLAPARHRGLPSPFLTLIFTLDEPLVMLAHPDPGQPPGEFGTLLGGLHSTPALMVHGGAQSGIQLAVRPLGVCAELRARVAAATCWRERFAVLDDIFLRLIQAGAADGVNGAAPPSEVAWAWRQLLVSGGTSRVSELAAGTGWSSRHLTSRFRTEIGLTPKAAARVIRFHRTRRLLVSQFAAGPRSGWLTWPRPADTLTRPIWPVSSARWRAARRASCWRSSDGRSSDGQSFGWQSFGWQSSETSKPPMARLSEAGQTRKER
jgi:AraC-like DNA-binding protein